MLRNNDLLAQTHTFVWYLRERRNKQTKTRHMIMKNYLLPNDNERNHTIE